jgi:hypothetical protein
MTNEFALYWALGFMAIYLVAQLAVSKLDAFKHFSRIQKSVLVKVLALVFFALGYAFSQWFH